MNKLIIFGLGAAVGSLLTWKLVEEKYKRLADEEIQSVIEQFNVSNKKVEPSIEVIPYDSKEAEEIHEKQKERTVKSYRDVSKMTHDDYEKITNKLGYDIDVRKEDNVIVSEEEDGSICIGPVVSGVAPYVISPDEFGETQYFGTKSWTYYADKIVTDEIGCIVDDPEEIIGDALTHFGEYEDDAVHVRNEDLECDYEIIRVDVTFEEINRGS